jgi:hypothetical protein
MDVGQEGPQEGFQSSPLFLPAGRLDKAPGTRGRSLAHLRVPVLTLVQSQEAAHEEGRAMDQNLGRSQREGREDRDGLGGRGAPLAPSFHAATYPDVQDGGEGLQFDELLIAVQGIREMGFKGRQCREPFHAGIRPGLTGH